MVYLILGIIIFCLIAFVLFAVLHCNTPYDRSIDDEQQEEFLRNYKNKKH